MAVSDISAAISSDEKVVAFILYPGVTILDIIGPLQVISRMRPPFRAVVVGESKVPMATDTNLSLMPEMTYDDVPRPFAIMVPGGLGATRAMGDRKLIGYLLDQANSVTTMGSICTGALILAAADLLDGRKATTHWSYQRILTALGAHYVPERWTSDGKFVTSAGVSAGIDMALALVAMWCSEEESRGIQIGLEYDPSPPFGPIRWSEVDLDARIGPIMQRIRSDLPHRPDIVSRIEGNL